MYPRAPAPSSNCQPKLFLLLIIIFFTLKALHRFTHAAKQSSTFYVLSRQRVQQSLTTWKTKFPTVKPYYAVKCNPDPTLIRWLSEGGVGFDCASIREVRIVDKVDRAAEVVFANPCKSDEEIKETVTVGIQATVVDSVEEIDKLKKNGWVASSLVRIRVEDKGSMMRFSAKFGLESSDLPELAAYAKERDLHLSGISFHVGSGCKDPAQFKAAIEQAKDSLQILRATGHHASTIDIGGGFMSGPLFNETAASIRPLLHSGDIRFIAEPGRFFAANSHDLFVRVIGKKPAGKGGKGWRYTLDESLYGQFSCIPFDYARPRWIRVRAEGEARRPHAPAVLYGRTCDSLDFIAAAEEAEELEEGDWLWFPHMGAYTTVTSTEFNGFPKPRCLVLEDTADGPANALPEPSDFQDSDWPSGIKYVSPVKVP